MCWVGVLSWFQVRHTLHRLFRTIFTIIMHTQMRRTRLNSLTNENNNNNHMEFTFETLVVDTRYTKKERNEKEEKWNRQRFQWYFWWSVFAHQWIPMDKSIQQAHARLLLSFLPNLLVVLCERKRSIRRKNTQPLALCSIHTFVTPRRSRCLNQTNFVLPCVLQVIFCSISLSFSMNIDDVKLLSNLLFFCLKSPNFDFDRFFASITSKK